MKSVVRTGRCTVHAFVATAGLLAVFFVVTPGRLPALENEEPPADEEMARAIGAINREIHGLAPVIQSPTLPNAATVTVTPPEVSADMARLLGPQGISVAVKRRRGMIYLFAVRMEGTPVRGTFALEGLAGETTVRVLGENRTFRAQDGRFDDDFGPHAVHLYEMGEPR